MSYEDYHDVWNYKQYGNIGNSSESLPYRLSGVAGECGKWGMHLGLQSILGAH